MNCHFIFLNFLLYTSIVNVNPFEMSLRGLAQAFYYLQSVFKGYEPLKPAIVHFMAYL